MPASNEREEHNIRVRKEVRRLSFTTDTLACCHRTCLLLRPCLLVSSLALLPSQAVELKEAWMQEEDPGKTTDQGMAQGENQAVRVRVMRVKVMRVRVNRDLEGGVRQQGDKGRQRKNFKKRLNRRER